MKWIWLAALMVAGVARAQWIEWGDLLINRETLEIREVGMAGVYGSTKASDLLREAQAGNANIIVAVVAPSYSYYRGYGLSGAVEHALDGGVTGFENAGSAFVGFGRSASEGSGSDGKSALYIYSDMSNAATDNQGNNPSSISDFAAWQGANTLADCVNVRNGVTITGEDANILVTTACSWFPATDPGAAGSSGNLTAFHVYGEYGTGDGGGSTLNATQVEFRNTNTTQNTASTTFRIIALQELNGEISGSTQLVRASDETPTNTGARIFGTSEETTSGVEIRLSRNSNHSSGLAGRSIRGSFFHAGVQLLRSEANAGNSIRWTITSSGGADYADLAAFFDTAGERGAAILRGDEMADNLATRGDTRPTYVVFFVMEDANTYNTLGDGASVATWQTEMAKLMDNLKLIGEGFTSVDDWGIMHVGQPPFHADNARKTAYGVAREAGRGYAEANASTHNIQYLDPTVYTDPANNWDWSLSNPGTGELFYNDSSPGQEDGNVHFSVDGSDEIALEAFEASLLFTGSGDGGSGAFPLIAGRRR